MATQQQLNLFDNCSNENELPMRTEINSVIKIFNPAPNILGHCIKYLKVKDTDYEFYRRKGKEKMAERKGIQAKMKCFEYDPITNILIIPFGMLHRFWGEIKKYPYSIEFNNSENFISIYSEQCPETMYDYQEEAVSKMIEAKSGVLVSPCGSGKTRMGIEIIHRLGKKFLWLTHNTDLLEQTYNAFKYLYPNIKLGEYSGSKKNFGEDGTIAMVQSLSKTDIESYANQFEVIVCDECAHTVGSSKNVSAFGKILNAVPARYKYGLTATPSRSDDLIKTMYMYLGTNKKGELAPTHQVPKDKVKTVTAQQIRIDLDTDLNNEERQKKYYVNFGKKNQQIDYGKLINVLTGDEQRTDEIINNVLMCSLESRKQIILCNRVEHIKEFAKKLQAKGLRAVWVSSKTKAKERKEILRNSSNSWDILCATYSLLKEGTDIPALDTIHLATPLVSKSTIVQSVGRIERICNGKKDPIAYDYVDKNLPYLEIAFFRRKKHLETRY